jgi:hypothetical protein
MIDPPGIGVPTIQYQLTGRCRKMATITMVKVQRCQVTGCCYNTDEMCHALAITVGGNAEHPACDTYCDLQAKGGNRSITAGVGACKVSSCTYNESLECNAPGITVGPGQDAADCLTYERR